ncbi:MAG: hypothetical protein BWY72_02557 [Bacteroidetes bacterium ADurb.Bin416]|nr:MAG: hypothetical protein BWY72_02557 [Bacteroidetes bacterium ADurb.Bin416]
MGGASINYKESKKGALRAPERLRLGFMKAPIRSAQLHNGGGVP